MYYIIYIYIDWHTTHTRLRMIIDSNKMLMTWGQRPCPPWVMPSYNPSLRSSIAALPVPSPRLFNEVFHKVQMSIVGCLFQEQGTILQNHLWHDFHQGLQKHDVTNMSTKRGLNKTHQNPRSTNNIFTQQYLGTAAKGLMQRCSILVVLEVDGSSFLHQSLHNHLATRQHGAHFGRFIMAAIYPIMFHQSCVSTTGGYILC